MLYEPPLPTPEFVPAPRPGATVHKPEQLRLTSRPGYPAGSLRCVETGKVVVTFCITAEGRIDNAQILTSSGFARLDNAVLAWMPHERYQPGTVNGRPRLFCGLHAEHTFEAETKPTESAAIDRGVMSPASADG